MTTTTQVQVLDSNQPLVTASSSAPSSSSAQVLDSIEPLVPTTTQVQVLDELVAGPSVMTGPSGAAGSCGSLSAIASSAEDEGEEFAAAMPRPTGSSGRRLNLYSDELSFDLCYDYCTISLLCQIHVELEKDLLQIEYTRTVCSVCGGERTHPIRQNLRIPPEANDFDKRIRASWKILMPEKQLPHQNSLLCYWDLV
ncbi:unnamed protein product [Parnassius apollo]|uniref:(apollo) hypothetical protein n=1 Tax=Parnassius apollo TaxID=110799 RepID=A0A8S3XRV0_PARAO|nr:unnamed protein product [Parnassius apollo]